jgi:hypothetical protein
LKRRLRGHERGEESPPNMWVKARLVALLATIAASLLWSSSFGQETKVCTITHDAPIIRVFLSEDYDALMTAGMKDKAAKDVACVVPKGTKVVIADFGAAYVSAHVVSGPQDGCVGNLARRYYSCKH